MPDSQRLLNPEEVAERLGLSPHTIRHWLRTGRLPGWHLGPLWRVREDDLKAFVLGLAAAGGCDREPTLAADSEQHGHVADAATILEDDRTVVTDDALATVEQARSRVAIAARWFKVVLAEARDFGGDPASLEPRLAAELSNMMTLIRPDLDVVLRTTRRFAAFEPDSADAEVLNMLHDMKDTWAALREWGARAADWRRPSFNAIDDDAHPWHEAAVRACELYDYRVDVRGELLWRAKLTEIEAICYLNANISDPRRTEREIGKLAGVSGPAVHKHLACATEKLAEPHRIAGAAAAVLGLDPPDARSELEVLRELMEQPSGQLWRVNRHAMSHKLRLSGGENEFFRHSETVTRPGSKALYSPTSALDTTAVDLLAGEPDKRIGHIEDHSKKAEDDAGRDERRLAPANDQEGDSHADET